MVKEPSLLYYLPIAGRRIVGFIPFPRILALCEIQIASSRIWARVTVSISYDYIHYTPSAPLVCTCVYPYRNLDIVSWMCVNIGWICVCFFFDNLLGKPPKVTYEPITRIISKQLDIKLGQFMQEELDSVLRKIENRKAAGLDEIPPELWKTRGFDDILLRHCNSVYNQNTIDRWTKGCILPFFKKGDLELAKNYQGITHTSIAAKIYNALLCNRIERKTDNILRKNQNSFRRNRSTTWQILTIHRILEGIRAKNLEATILFVNFTKDLDSIHRGKMEQILLAYGLPKETVAAIMILYRNTKVKVHSPDGDIDYFDRWAARRHISSIPLCPLFRLRALSVYW